MNRPLVSTPVQFFLGDNRVSRIQKQLPVENLSSASFPEPASPDLRLRGGTIRSVLDLLQALDEVDHLPVLRRRVLKANIRTAGFVAARAKALKEGRGVSASREDPLLATVPIDLRWLNEHLFAYAARLCCTSEQNRHLSISGLRRAMRFFDLLEVAGLAPDGRRRWTRACSPPV